MPGGGGGGSSGRSQTAQSEQYYGELADISREQWDTYKEHFVPLYSHLAAEAVRPTPGSPAPGYLSAPGYSAPVYRSSPGYRSSLGDSSPGYRSSLGDSSPGYRSSLGDSSPGYRSSLGDSSPGYSSPGYSRPDYSSLDNWVGERVSAASADVAQSYDQAAAGLRRSLGRYGITPGSGRYIAATRDLALGRASAKAGAMTAAERGAHLDRRAESRADLAYAAEDRAAHRLDLDSKLAYAAEDRAAHRLDLDTKFGYAAEDRAAHRLDLDTKFGYAAEDRAAHRLDLDTKLAYAAEDRAARGERLNRLRGALGMGSGLSGTSGLSAAAGGLSNIGQDTADRRAANRRGFGQFLGTAATAGAMFFSDPAVKTDVRKVGQLDDGLNVYRYRYKGDPVTRIGLMADEVEAVKPAAVRRVGGLRTVDYDAATAPARG